jgi:hypothetical protein
MKVWGYFDASGTHDDLDRQGRPSPAVSVAGYLATPKQWQNFAVSWRERLAEDKLPYFHMASFVAQMGIFKNRYEWPKERRDALILDLIRIIQGGVIYGIGMSVRRADYDRVMKALPSARKVFGSPFTFCSYMCLMTGRDWAYEAKYTDSIKYIFEDGDEFKHEVLDAHARACADDKTREFYNFSAGGLTFEDGTKVGPLQAADILAYECYREEKRKVYEDIFYTRNSAMALFSIQGEYKYYTEEDVVGYLMDFIDGGQNPKRHHKQFL